jgi:hypothetical protein
MIEKTEDLGMSYEETAEELEKILKEKLGIGFADMTEALSQYTQEHAEELSKDFFTITPYEDYGKLIEDQGKITEFIRQQASKPENWEAIMMEENRSAKDLHMLTFVFHNKAVDNGESLFGYVYVSFDGKILRSIVVSDGD